LLSGNYMCDDWEGECLFQEALLTLSCSKTTRRKELD